MPASARVTSRRFVKKGRRKAMLWVGQVLDGDAPRLEHEHKAASGVLVVSRADSVLVVSRADSVRGVLELRAGRCEGSHSIIMSTAHVHPLIHQKELEVVILALVYRDPQWRCSILGSEVGVNTGVCDEELDATALATGCRYVQWRFYFRVGEVLGEHEKNFFFAFRFSAFCFPRFGC